MKITTQITKRDIFLIYLMVFGIVIFVFVRYIFIPANETKAELKLSIEDAEYQMIEMQSGIAMLPAAQKNYTDAVTVRDTLLEDMYPLMLNYELDRMISEMMRDHSLTTESFAVTSDTRKTSLIPYYVSEMARELLTSDAETPANGDIYEATVSVTAYGNYADIMRLIDELAEDYKAIGITSYSFSDRQLSAGLDENGKPLSYATTLLNINLSIYMRAAEE